MFIAHGVLSKTMNPFYGRQKHYAANGADEFFAPRRSINVSPLHG
jgi:hypothetical protein